MEKLTAAQKRALQRRNHVASEVGLVFLGLSGEAHNLLILLKFLQGTEEETWLPDKTLQRTLDIDEATFWDAMDELESKGVVIYGFPDDEIELGTFTVFPADVSADEMKIFTGKNPVEIPEELCPR